jgi:hypothetical protein
MAGDGTQRRRRRRKCSHEDDIPQTNAKDTSLVSGLSVDHEDNILETTSENRLKRECPIPKPVGFVGEMLGLKTERSKSDGFTRPP